MATIGRHARDPAQGQQEGRTHAASQGFGMKGVGAAWPQEDLLEAEGGGAPENRTQVARVLDAPGAQDPLGQWAGGAGSQVHDEGVLRRAAGIRQLAHEGLAENQGLEAEGSFLGMGRGCF